MKVDHVGVAVESIEKALPFYREQLGLVVVHREDVASQNVKVAFLGHPKDEGTQIELLEPLGDEGAVASFLKNRGGGVHHIAFETEGIERSIERFKQAGKPTLEDKPRPGSRGHQVCFVHPKHASGVLIELVEKKAHVQG